MMKNLSVLSCGMMLMACGGAHSGDSTEACGAERTWSQVDAKAVATLEAQVSANISAQYQGEVSVALGGCPETHDAQQITSELALALELERNVSLLRGSGAPALDVSRVLDENLIQLFLKAGVNLLPAHLTYAEDGAFTAQLGASSGISVRAYAYVKAGNELHLLGDDLFDLDSYLVGAKLAADADLDLDIDLLDPFASEIDFDAQVRLDYERPGPLAPLLGFGNPPPRPLVLSKSLVTSFKPTLAELYFSTEVSLEYQRGGMRVSLSAASEPESVPELISQKKVQLRFASLTLEDSRLQQKLTLSESGGTLHSSAGKQLDGELAFQIEGSQKYTGSLRYEDSRRAHIAVSCAK